jgi:hypothetical protein
MSVMTPGMSWIAVTNILLHFLVLSRRYSQVVKAGV